MPLDNSNSESDRIKRKKDRAIYSNYLAIKTQYDNGTYGYPSRIVAGTGASLESSFLENIRIGEINVSPAEQAAIIAANTSVSPYGSVSVIANAYLTTGLFTNFSMGTGDFTVECWANSSAAISGGWTNLVSLGSAAGKDIRIAAGGDFFSPNGGKIGFIIPNNAGTVDLRCRTTITMTPNTWYHFALVRSSGVVKFYVNGSNTAFKDDATGTNYTTGITVTFNHSGDVNGKSNFFVNNSLFNESQFAGLISNVRLVKGLAVYTSNFTVPNRLLTAVSGTQILLNTATSTTYLRDSSSYDIGLFRYGSIAYSTSNPFS
jgi:hypothetical protein